MIIIKFGDGEYRFSNSIELTDSSIKIQGESETLMKSKVAPIFIGVGSENIHCDECGVKLVSNIKREQIEKITIECPECGALMKL
jgi:DNA-directed RNA polymerase subunit RPC12/RpoP